MRGVLAVLACSLLGGCCCSTGSSRLSRDPLPAQDHLLLGDLYRKNGNFEGAEREYRLCLEQNHGHVPAHRRMGEMALARGEYRTARDHFETVVAATPGDPVACNNLAWTLLKRREALPRARELAVGAVSAADDRLRPGCLQTLSQIEAALGDFPAAVEAAGRAMREWPGGEVPPALVLDCAEWKRRAGHAEEARADARALLETLPAGSPEAERARRIAQAR